MPGLVGGAGSGVGESGIHCNASHRIAGQSWLDGKMLSRSTFPQLVAYCRYQYFVAENASMHSCHRGSPL